MRLNIFVKKLNMVEKIVQISDIHVRKTTIRNNEYEIVFNNLIESLKNEKPDRIVIVGDLVNDYLDLQPEQLILVCNLLNNLALIAPVRITRGNHDMRTKNIKRIDAIEAIVKTLNNDNVIYYNKTGFYDDDNITWAVWHFGEKNNNPWKNKKYVKNNNTYIDLIHDSINGSCNPNGFVNKSKSLIDKNELKGDFSFIGHIHKMQYL